VRLFNVWALLDKQMNFPAQVSSWPVPSLARLRDTAFGATDFGLYSAGMGDRFAVRGGQLLRLPREAWKAYLGPASSLVDAPVPQALCQDSQFMSKRLERIARFSPRIEVDNLKNACGMSIR
jgi:hypothetical protein